VSASIPNLGEMALQLEYRLVEAVEADPMGREISAEIAQTVADARQMDLAGLLAWGRALQCCRCHLLCPWRRGRQIAARHGAKTDREGLRPGGPVGAASPGKHREALAPQRVSIAVTGYDLF
jgi:hypothetical protein